MHDIWNPWHGCRKCSEGCENCYMYYLDEAHGRSDSSVVKLTGNMSYPLSRDRRGRLKIRSGETVRVCMTSDFFVEEADEWRGEAWSVIHSRPDVIFFLLTKRPERVEKCLPRDWGEGWENVFFNVTCENMRRADERIPLLLSLPFRHKGIMTAPLIGGISIAKYLSSGEIEQVICGGENYGGARVCRYEWVKKLSDECREANVTFAFIETGTRYEKDGRLRVIPDKTEQARVAFSEGLSRAGQKRPFDLRLPLGISVPESELYRPHYRRVCLTCGSRLICNGCSDCGKCGSDPVNL